MFGHKHRLELVAPLLTILEDQPRDFSIYDPVSGHVEGTMIVLDLALMLSHCNASHGLGISFTKMRAALIEWQSTYGIQLSRAVLGDRDGLACCMPVKAVSSMCDVYGRVFTADPIDLPPSEAMLTDILARTLKVNWYCPGHTYMERSKILRETAERAVMPALQTLMAQAAIGLPMTSSRLTDEQKIADAYGALLHHIRVRMGTSHGHYFRVEFKVKGSHVKWMTKLLLEYPHVLKVSLCSSLLVTLPHLKDLDEQLLIGAEKLLDYVSHTVPQIRHTLTHGQLSAFRACLLCLAVFMWHGDMDPPTSMRGLARVDRALTRQRGWMTLKVNPHDLPFVSAAVDSTPSDIFHGHAQAIAGYVYGILTGVKYWRPGPALPALPDAHVVDLLLRDAASVLLAAHWCAMFQRAGGVIQRTSSPRNQTWYLQLGDWHMIIPVAPQYMGVSQYGLWTCARAVIETVAVWSLRAAIADSVSSQQLVFMPEPKPNLSTVANALCSIVCMEALRCV